MPFSEKHTSANIADWLVKHLDDWQLTNITEMIVSDTASNQMGVFNDELAPHLPRQELVFLGFLLIYMFHCTGTSSLANVVAMFSS